MDNILLQSAMDYAQRGWYVFPCREADSEVFWDEKKGRERIMPAKSPYLSDGVLGATLDKKLIKDWWLKYPDAAIGISCGASGLLVVDIDVKNGRVGFNNFMSLNVSDAGALHSLTPSGGMHIIFKGRTHSHANVSIGIDIRSEGAYIVAPPSFIYIEEKRKYYKSLDDWSREPVDVPNNLIYRLDIMRRGKDRKHKPNNIKFYSDDLDALVRRARKALEALPQRYCDDYFLWIEVGLALKSLGEAGFNLWDEWSRKSSKYQTGICSEKWETFKPREISIASLFYWAKQNSELQGEKA